MRSPNAGRITAIHNWKSENYPFDTQNLHIILEAGLDTSEMIMLPLGKDFKIYKDLSLPGWEIAAHSYKTGLVNYDSDFGETCLKGKSSFSRISYEIVIRRKGWGLFCKLLFGAYISFFVAFLSFFLPPSRDQRFGLSIGGLFAAIANKYVMDSDIPSSISFSFIDQVHVLTFGFVLLTLILSVVALKRYKDNHQQRLRFDRKSAIVVLTLYTLINVVLIIVAYHV